MSSKKRQQPAVVEEEEEEAFPRGGADDLTPLERRKLALQAEADFKHEQDGATGDAEAPTKKKQKRANDQAGYRQHLCYCPSFGDSSSSSSNTAVAACSVTCKEASIDVPWLKTWHVEPSNMQ